MKREKRPLGLSIYRGIASRLANIWWKRSPIQTGRWLRLASYIGNSIVVCQRANAAGLANPSRLRSKETRLGDPGWMWKRREEESRKKQTNSWHKLFTSLVVFVVDVDVVLVVSRHYRRHESLVSLISRSYIAVPFTLPGKLCRLRN